MKNGSTLFWIMVFTSTKFALNKTTLSRKFVPTRRNQAFDKNPFPLGGKTASAVRNRKNRRKLV